jgi:hypothetical protein
LCTQAQKPVNAECDKWFDQNDKDLNDEHCKELVTNVAVPIGGYVREESRENKTSGPRRVLVNEVCDAVELCIRNDLQMGAGTLLPLLGATLS